MIKKLLIANRGEIACRIIKTARRLQIKTVAIYSTIDKNALHVKLADEAFLLGEPPATQSYLNAEKIIEIAKVSKADAIHPGYGFLSEDADFALLCEKNNIIFVGPSGKAIDAMGDKCNAKKLMEDAKVPVVPGYQGKTQDLKTLQSEAKKIGLPVLIKAAAGGGGKGMRLVTDLNQLEEALNQAKREAKSSFGDETVFLEKYIEPARHVEVQIFMDQKGHGVYLFDRDCSLQRRHQKIIEEAPAPDLPEKVRQQMGETAIMAGKAIDYVGAGTIEFLVDQNANFYFMEMNTRLQVEHPVTEMITNLDLVEWQLKIASDETLPLKQSELKNKGHAFEARIYAENPKNNFSPSIGKLVYCRFPETNDYVRVDTGVQIGDTISPYYDPLIAKLIVWEKDRATALTQLKKSLSEVFIVGLETNVAFLAKIADNKHFKETQISTNFVEQHTKDWLASSTLSESELALIAFAKLQEETHLAKKLTKHSNDKHSPWTLRDHWRSFKKSNQTLNFWYQNQPYTLTLSVKDNIYQIQSGTHNFEFKATNHTDNIQITLKNETHSAHTFFTHDQLHLFSNGEHYVIAWQDPQKSGANTDAGENHFISPLPGTVVEILVKPGQVVKKGERLMTLEAMKMEHSITAPSDGVIKTVHYKVGDLINEGVELLSFQIK